MNTNSGPQAEARASVIDRLLADVRGYTYDQLAEGTLGSAERHLLLSYSLQEGDLRGILSESPTGIDAAIRRLEHDRVRPLVNRVRQFVLRHHLTLAEPFWGWDPTQENANHVCFAGTIQLRAVLSPLLEQLGLAVASTPRGWDPARAHWKQLRESGLAIFDLTGGSRQLRASVSYRLGWALSLGKPLLVVTRSRARLPFDIDVEPIAWDPSDGPSAALAEAVDGALFALHSAAEGSSVRTTVQYAMSRFSFDDPAVCALQSETTPDPIHAFNVLHSVLEQESSARLALLHPLWPGSYPCVEQPRCFHVTPFHPSFDGARGAIRKACSANGVRYGRGDETGEHHIIRSIWDEIGKAHVVVVDITNLNVNVALELGLADALGRPALIVARDRVGALFPEISHRPVMVYQSSSELHELVRMALLRRN